MIPFIILIGHESPGLIQDAIIYNKYIPNSNIVYLKDITNKNVIIPNKYNLILLENLGFIEKDNHFVIFIKAKKRYFMVNIDLFYPTTKLYSYINVYLCKFKFTEQCIKRMISNNLINPKVLTYYTKHTSILSEDFELYNPKIKKDFKLFLHSAGKSPLKNTSLVIETWLNYNLPPIYITCYSMCLNLILKKLSDKYDLSIDNLKKHNIIFLSNTIDIDLVIELKNKCGIHLCPSMKEGYGHYINECRQVKSVCITIDGKPFTELVNKNTGFLLPYNTKVEHRLNKHYDYTFNPKDLYNTVKNILNTPESDLKNIGKKAYKHYLSDLDYLQEKLRLIRQNT